MCRTGAQKILLPAAAAAARPALLVALLLALTVAVVVDADTPSLRPQPVWATPDYASSTGKDCPYCHVTPGGSLTAAGQAFRDNGHELPADSAPPTSNAGGAAPPTTPPEADDDGPAVSGPLLPLPTWLRGLLRWVHILAAIAWLGGLMSVVLVQRPQVAMAGIPRGYLRLAWPAIALVGAAGFLLTLGDITDPDSLTQSRWGRLLLVKMGIYLYLTLMAALATLVVSPGLERTAETERRRGASQEQYQAQGRVTVRYRGRVYDVTGSRLWPEGRHMKRHGAWQDLTTELSGAPHGSDVLERFTVIEEARDDQAPRLRRLFLAMVYANVFFMLMAVWVVAVW